MITFKRVEEATIKYVKICNDPKAKLDGRFKDAKLNFINCLRTYINDQIKRELKASGIESFLNELDNLKSGEDWKNGGQGRI